MHYRARVARTPAQRGKVGNWLVESRLARGWDTQAEARREIARLTGWTIPQSVYAEWESGRRLPSDANLERLTAFYGEQPTSTVAEGAAIAAAIDRQTEVIRELVNTSRARDAVLEGLLTELAAYRREAVAGRVVEQSLIEALPGALATALAAMRGDDPVDEPLDTPPRETPARR